jgi:diguanylate cyclase (GGDEF)-like protein
MSMMVMLLGCYVFIPNRFLTALSVCVASSVTFLWLVLSHFQMPSNQAFNFGLLLFGMNLFGGITCYRISWARRDEYRHTLSQRQANLLLGVEIENRRRLESELRDQAMLDSLTGLPNRRFFLERLGTQLDTAQQEGSPLSLLIVDIDYFRQINATYSHVRGDEMLRHLGGLCRQLAPAETLVARLSGEEFVLLVPGMGREAASTLAESLRLSAQSACVRSLDASLYFTISVGVTEARPNDSIDQLLSRADEALRAAKYAGRNRVKAA